MESERKNGIDQETDEDMEVMMLSPYEKAKRLIGRIMKQDLIFIGELKEPSENIMRFFAIILHLTE